MSDPDLIHSLSTRIPDALAGIAGGIVNVFVFKRSDPFSILGSIVVGALTATYLSSTIVKHMPFDVSNETGGFFIGLGGMAFCQLLVDYMLKTRLTKDQTP